MATTHIIGRTFYSGQGMCNTVEAYDGATLTDLMLVDFGAEKDTATVRLFTLPDICKLIVDHKRIDIMVISHSDKDHWKLMSEVLDALPSEIMIGTAVFGLGNWVNGAQDFRDKVIARIRETKTDLFIFEHAVTDILPGSINTWKRLGDAQVNILAASTVERDVRPEGTDSVETNAASIVVRVAFSGRSLVFTADATWITLRYMNNQIAKMPAEFRKALSNGFMMTAPHHGALATLEGNLADLVTFTGSVQPLCSLASAQLRMGFFHPNINVMAAMSKYVGQGIFKQFDDYTHNCVINFRETNAESTDDVYKELVNHRTADCENDWWVVRTNYNIFTCLRDGDTGVHWYFTLFSGERRPEVTVGTLPITAGNQARPLIDRSLAEEVVFFVGEQPDGSQAIPNAATRMTTPSGNQRVRIEDEY
jgi:hypothetical protein